MGECPDAFKYLQEAIGFKVSVIWHRNRILSFTAHKTVMTK